MAENSRLPGTTALWQIAVLLVAAPWVESSAQPIQPALVWTRPDVIHLQTGNLGLALQASDASMTVSVNRSPISDPGFLEVEDPASGVTDRCSGGQLEEVGSHLGILQCNLHTLGLGLEFVFRIADGVSDEIQLSGSLEPRSDAARPWPLVVTIRHPMCKDRWAWQSGLRDPVLLTRLDPVLESDLLMSAHVGDRVGSPLVALSGSVGSVGMFMPADSPQWARLRAVPLPDRELQLEIRTSVRPDRPSAGFSAGLISMNPDAAVRCNPRMRYLIRSAPEPEPTGEHHE